jgi:S-adenosylmethionine decarboxylase
MKQEISATEQWSTGSASQGLRLLGEWFQCRGQRELFVNAQALRGVCRAAAQNAGLTVVGELFHPFPHSGVTGTLVLADSYLVINTRPEDRSVTLDVFIIDHVPADRLKAHALYSSLRDRLSPEKENYLQINRGGPFEVVSNPV